MGRALWKLANSFSPEYRRFQHQIEAFVRLDPTQAAQRARQLLHQYLHYCRTYSPYWRERWPNEAREFAADEAEDVLRLLPPLTKSELRTHQGELRITPEHRRRRDGFPVIGRQSTIRSGGSTGVPVAVTIDSCYGARSRANYDFFYRICGLPPGEPFFYIWGSTNELVDLKQSWKKRFSSWLRQVHPLPAFGLSPDKIKWIRDELDQHREIRSAVCFASAGETIVNYADREQLSFRRLERVFTGGGLLHDRLRELLQKHLANEVFNSYASRDLGMIAHETPAHDGLSVAEWFSKVEVLNAGNRPVGPGEQGEVHVTALNNYSHALIRVATGDTARWHPDQGRNPVPAARLHDLAGRTVEHLVGPHGIVIDPSAVIHLVGVVIAPAWLRKFQLVQISEERYELRAESWEGSPTRELISELQSRLERELSHLVRHPLSVTVRIVREIPPLPSGKHQYCKRDFDSPLPACMPPA